MGNSVKCYLVIELEEDCELTIKFSRMEALLALTGRK